MNPETMNEFFRVRADGYDSHMLSDVGEGIEPILLDRTKDKSGFVQNVFKTGQIIYHMDRIVQDSQTQ